MHFVEQHYRKRLAEAKEKEGQADFHALDQGEARTTLRYEAIAKFVEGLEGWVLDWGCGTGAILDTLVERGRKPFTYIGVDGLDRDKAVTGRLTRHQIGGKFVLKPMETRFEDKPHTRVDVVLCIGVTGYWGYHTNRQVVSLYDAMRGTGIHGALTMPLIYAPDQMGDEHVRRWPLDEMLELLHLKESNVIAMEREIILYW